MKDNPIDADDVPDILCDHSKSIDQANLSKEPLDNKKTSLMGHDIKVVRINFPHPKLSLDRATTDLERHVFCRVPAPIQSPRTMEDLHGASSKSVIENAEVV